MEAKGGEERNCMNKDEITGLKTTKILFFMLKSC